MLDRIAVGGTDLYYEAVGEGPPLVFLHGFSGNHLTWWQQLPTFAADYRCVAPDQRSFGLSVDADDGPGVTAFVDDLVALLDHLGHDRVAVVGHSMSGWPAASLATQYPDRVAALALSGTPGGLLPMERHQEILAEAEGTLPEVDPLTPELAHLEDDIAELNRDSPEEWDDIHPVLEAELPTDPGALDDAGIPVMLIAGEADGFMPEPAVRALAGRLEDVRTEIVGGVGHSVNFEDPAAFNGRLAAFLEDNAF